MEIFARTATLAGLWWLISQGRPDAWLVGLPAVALASWASIRMAGNELSGLSLAGLVAFIALFLRESVRGGLDVARRTLGPELRIRRASGGTACTSGIRRHACCSSTASACYPAHWPQISTAIMQSCTCSTPARITICNCFDSSRRLPGCSV